MSISYYADLVVGIRIRRDDLYVEKEIPGCKHSVPKNAKFCPECGKQSKKTEEHPLPKFDEDDRYGDLDVVRIGYEGGDVIVGRKLAGVGGYREADSVSVDLKKISDASDEVMEALEGEPIKGEFGIWLCQSAS